MADQTIALDVTPQAQRQTPALGVKKTSSGFDPAGTLIGAQKLQAALQSGNAANIAKAFPSNDLAFPKSLPPE